MESYRPVPYDGSMVLFRCTGVNDKYEHTPGLGWETCVRGGLHVIPVPGVHLELFNDSNAAVLAAKLDEILASLLV